MWGWPGRLAWIIHEVLKGSSFPRRACPREGVGRESTLQAGCLTWISVNTEMTAADRQFRE